MTILTGIGLKTRKAKYEGRRWMGGAVFLLALEMSSCWRIIPAAPRWRRSTRLHDKSGTFGWSGKGNWVSLEYVWLQENNFLFGLGLFSLSGLNAPSLVSSNICSLEFSSLFTSISMVGGSSWPFSFQVSCDFSLTVERRWISTLPSDEEN